MKLLMLSTDRNMLDPQSAVFQRTLEYATHCETLTVIVAGTGVTHEYVQNNLRVVHPGGRSKVTSLFRMLYWARLVGGDVITAQDPFFMGLVAVLTGIRPLQIQMHTTHFGFLGSVLARITLPFATCVRVVSEDVRRRIQPLTRASVSVLPIFVDTERLRVPLPRPSEFGQHKVVLAVSRLTKEKRVDLIIASISHVPDAHLYIVGDGPLRARLALQAERLELKDRVHFLGWQHDVRAYYQHADCFVQLSAYEGYGMSLVEAVVSGVPAVSTDVGVAHELSPELVTLVSPNEYSVAEAVRARLAAGRQESRARDELLLKLGTKAAYVEQYIHLLTTCGTV